VEEYRNRPDVPTSEAGEPRRPRGLDDDELLVHVHAVGVGVHDAYFLPQGVRYPFPVGIEAAGVVEEIGADVRAHRSGDRIAFVSTGQPKGGTWAEYVAVRADSLIVPVPAGMSFPQAAAVPVAGNTALKIVRTLDDLPAGARVFVAGVSGAIGTFLLQLGRDRGWRIAASASKPNHDHLHTLGAELAVDYQDPAWQRQVLEWTPGGVDAAIAIQPGTTADSMRVVRDGGTALTVSGDEVQAERGIQAGMFSLSVDVRDDLVEFLDQIVGVEKQVTIERVYPFEQGGAALAKAQTRRARGKVVLTLEPPEESSRST
jgi:NADPH:quinone reductase